MKHIRGRLATQRATGGHYEPTLRATGGHYACTGCFVVLTLGNAKRVP